MTGMSYIDGVPHVWGRRATEDKDFDGSVHEMMGSSSWVCPHCGAHLRKSSETNLEICLNACHLTAPQFHELQRGLAEAAVRVQQKNRIKHDLAT